MLSATRRSFCRCVGLVSLALSFHPSGRVFPDGCKAGDRGLAFGSWPKPPAGALRPRPLPDRFSSDRPRSCDLARFLDGDLSLSERSLLDELRPSCGLRRAELPGGFLTLISPGIQFGSSGMIAAAPNWCTAVGGTTRGISDGSTSSSILRHRRFHSFSSHFISCRNVMFCTVSPIARVVG